MRRADDPDFDGRPLAAMFIMVGAAGLIVGVVLGGLWWILGVFGIASMVIGLPSLAIEIAKHTSDPS